MSGEFRGNTVPAPIECRDVDGSEIIPTTEISAALRCPDLLRPELASVAIPPKPFEDRLRASVERIETVYRGAHYLRIAEDEGWPQVIEGWRSEAAQMVESAPLYDKSSFDDMAEAVFRLSPDEFAALSGVIEESKGDLTDGDLAAIGLYSPMLDSRGARSRETLAGLSGNHSRLRENTRNNLKGLLDIEEAYISLLVVEGHSFLSSSIGQLMLWGDDNYRSKSYELLDRLKDIANVTDDRRAIGQLVAQGLVWRKLKRTAVDLAAEAPDPEISPATLANFVDNLDKQRVTAWGNNMTANIMTMSAYGRAFRLNGNAHLANSRLADGLNISSIFDFVHGSGNQGADEQAKEDSQFQQYADKIRRYLANLSVEQPDVLSAKKIKGLKLEEARAALVKGERDSEGNLIVEGRSKQDALRYISDIEFVLGFMEDTRSLGDAMYQLDRTLSDTSQARRSIDAFINDPGGKRNMRLLEAIGVDAPEIEGPDTLVEELKSDWSTVEHLVSNYWPEGTKTAEQLRQLLFLSYDDLKAAEDTQPGAAELEEPEELEPDDVIDIKPLESQSALAEIAKQLDEIILPPMATQADAERVVKESGLSESEAAVIDWDRLFNLVQLREEHDGTMYRSKPGDLGNAPPYFVVSLDAVGSTFAVAESPVEGNATYIVSEKLCPGTWLEVLGLSKAEARDVGARRVIHGKGRTAEDHYTKINNVLMDLTTVKS